MNDTGLSWIQSCRAGYRDRNGRYTGGSKIMHLVPHKDQLFAVNGYWMDLRWRLDYNDRQSAQVLRLGSSNGEWEVDLEIGQANGSSQRYMKGNVLQSVTFTHNGSADSSPQPEKLLLMSAGAYYGEQRGVVSVWVRDDNEGNWSHSFVKSGSAANGLRWIPRDIEVYTGTGIGTHFCVIAFRWQYHFCWWAQLLWH